MFHKRWTPVEIELLRTHHADHTHAWIAERLDRPVGSVKTKLRNLNMFKFKVRVMRRKAERIARTMPGVKLCRECGQVKPLADFHRQASAKDGLQNRCKRCAVLLATAWNKAHPDRFQATSARSYRKRTYGLSQEQYEALMARQGDQCGICGAPNRLKIDHDHVTGGIRGLLCNRCNTALGMLGDTPEAIERVLVYLRRSASTPAASY